MTTTAWTGSAPSPLVTEAVIDAAGDTQDLHDELAQLRSSDSLFRNALGAISARTCDYPQLTAQIALDAADHLRVRI